MVIPEDSACDNADTVSVVGWASLLAPCAWVCSLSSLLSLVLVFRVHLVRHPVEGHIFGVQFELLLFGEIGQVLHPFLACPGGAPD